MYILYYYFRLYLFRDYISLKFNKLPIPSLIFFKNVIKMLLHQQHCYLSANCEFSFAPLSNWFTGQIIHRENKPNCFHSFFFCIFAQLPAIFCNLPIAICQLTRSMPAMCSLCLPSTLSSAAPPRPPSTHGERLHL